MLLFAFDAPSRHSRVRLGLGGSRDGRDGGKQGQLGLGTMVAKIATAFVLPHLDMEKLTVLQMETLLLSVFSKSPRTQQNDR
jgi:hypothetical protein